MSTGLALLLIYLSLVVLKDALLMYLIMVARSGLSGHLRSNLYLLGALLILSFCSDVVAAGAFLRFA